MPSRDGSSPLSRLRHGGRLARPVAERWFRAADGQARKETLIDLGGRLTLFPARASLRWVSVSFTAPSRTELEMATGRHRPVESGGDAAPALQRPPVKGGRSPDAGGMADLADEVWLPDRVAVAEGARAQLGKSGCRNGAQALLRPGTGEVTAEQDHLRGSPQCRAMSSIKCPRLLKTRCVLWPPFACFVMSGSQR